MKSDAQKIFQTTDFGLAIFLFAKEVSLIAIEPTEDTKKSAFLFQTVENLPVLVEKFWSGEELIEPSRLLSAERELKRRLHSDSYRIFQKPGSYVK